MSGKTGSAFDIPKMIELAGQNFGTIRIGRRVGCSPGTVRYHLDRAGVRRSGVSNTQFEVKYQTNPSSFDGLSPQSRWAIGLMAADGNVVASSKKLRFGQSDGNIDLLNDLAVHIGHVGKPYFAPKTNSHMMTWTSSRHVTDLAAYGVVDRKSLIYKLPDIELLDWDFLRGYIDGDGSVGLYSNGTHRKYLRISWVGNPDFIRQCASWLPDTGKIYSRGAVDEITFHGKNAFEVGEKIYSSNLTNLTRKHANFLSAVEGRK